MEVAVAGATEVEGEEERGMDVEMVMVKRTERVGGRRSSQEGVQVTALASSFGFPFETLLALSLRLIMPLLQRLLAMLIALRKTLMKVMGRLD